MNGWPRLAVMALTLFAAPLAAQTNPTGDRIDGISVIDRLDASDLAAGQTHRFWFRVAPTASAGHGMCRSSLSGARVPATACC